MFVDDKISHNAANELYILLTAYVRNEGKVAADYNMEFLKEGISFLHDILKHSENFIVKKAEPEAVEK